MGAYPGNEQVHFPLSEHVVADHAVIVAANVKHYPVTAVSQQVCGAERFQYIRRAGPAGVL